MEIKSKTLFVYFLALWNAKMHENANTDDVQTYTEPRHEISNNLTIDKCRLWRASAASL